MTKQLAIEKSGHGIQLDAASLLSLTSSVIIYLTSQT